MRRPRFDASWKQTGRDTTRIAARTISDAHIVEAVRETAWTTNHLGVRKLAPEGLYGRRKMTAALRRTTAPDASAGCQGPVGTAQGRSWDLPGDGHEICPVVAMGSAQGATATTD